MRSKRLVVASISVLMFIWLIPSKAEVEVFWLGHGTVRLTSEAGKVIMIDAFLKKNPATPEKYKDLAALGKVDLILITHGHIDHVDDLVELARMNDAKVVANYELAFQLATTGAIKKSHVIDMNKGGTVSPLGRGINIHMVPAEHSSALDLRVFGSDLSDAANFDRLRFLEGGVAVGYVIEFENGFKVYASGDTHVFGDMELIREFHAPDLALLSIGGHFTMGPEDAAYAARELIKPKQVIPIHYGTYPIINRTPIEFMNALGDTSIEVLALKPGEAVRF